MRKALIILGLAIVLTLAMVSVVSADYGPHGDYTNTTAACAGCHRAHTAIGENLLVKTTEWELCTMCHGNDGAGAQTNVVSGVYVDRMELTGTGTDGAALNGGGFLFIGASQTTSAHNVEGMEQRGWIGATPDSGQTAPAWGGGTAVGLGATSASGDYAGNYASSIVLKCSSCHNPHGSTNYRILRDYTYSTYHGSASGRTEWSYEANNSGITDDGWWHQDNQVLATNLDTGSERYTVSAKADPNSEAPADAQTSYLMNYTASGMSRFCSTCHQRYNVTSSTRDQDGYLEAASGDVIANDGPYDAGDGLGEVGRYRHSVTRSGTQAQKTLLPLRMGAASDFVTSSPTDTNRMQMSCLTCHYAHGSTARMDSYAVKAFDPDSTYVDNPSEALLGDGSTGPGGVGPSNDSALLLHDNRGVCQSCHQKKRSATP